MQIDQLHNGLIVSCQPVPGGPMDNARSVVGFALAALAGGACALRIESLAYVRAVRTATTAPIIGIVKHDRVDTAVRITPTVDLATGLCDAGADIVAFDATRRSRPNTVLELLAAVKSRGRFAMADCSDLDDARAALAAGVDLVGTTLAGYVGGPEPAGPDFDLIAAMRQISRFVVAEGRIHTPEQAAEAVRRGAYCVVVGSALTRTEHATQWFRTAVDAAAAERPSPGGAVLAIDVGGTKILAALVERDRVVAETALQTDLALGPDGWLKAVAGVVDGWKGRYSAVAAAVTGFVNGGEWSALNPAILGIDGTYPLVHRLEETFGVPALACNDAQAAAWGEYRYGAGAGQDMVFLTISTGIGGGIVLNGRLLPGLAGHFGQLRLPSVDRASPFENEVSGRWIAVAAERAGHPMTAAEVFAHAAAGEDWAESIVAASASKVAQLCADIQLTLDPRRIVVGGGIGLAPGFLERIEAHLSDVPAGRRPKIVRALLGGHAGVIGVANLR